MLKSRLEIAQFKVGRSWQNLPFKSVEPQLEREAKMRNPEAFAGGDARHTNVSSPPTDPEFLVPDVPTRAKAPQERPARQSTPAQPNGNGTSGEPSRHRISPLKRHRSDSFEHDLPELESSPIKYRPSTSSLRDRIDPRIVHGHITPPPSTPPPSHLRQAHNSIHGHGSSRRTGGSGEDAEEGADLLLYLATSPSPAKSRRTTANHRTFEAFSSPPPMRGSSAVNTPVGAGFNLSEFLNFTP